MAAIMLRSATTTDEERCFELHEAAMGPYVAQIWGWDELAQRVFHARAFDPNQWQIITCEGQDVGMLHVEHRPAEIYLARIELHPDHQGHGIGSRLIRDLLHQARREGKDLSLDVLTINERARALYRRLGLHDVTLHGENDIKIRMSTRPPQQEPNQQT
jgi:ribosomal protein S18 acetylase RimI-like enzyme